MIKDNSLLIKTDELRKLILENPDLPIVVLAGTDANIGEYGWMYCSNVSFGIDEILDYDITDYEDYIFTDRDRLEEYIEDVMWDENIPRTDEEWETEKEKRLKELEPYWKKVIEIRVDN